MRDWRRGKAIAAERDQDSVNTFHISEFQTTPGAQSSHSLPAAERKTRAGRKPCGALGNTSGAGSGGCSVVCVM